jgi:hypothetical protein
MQPDHVLVEHGVAGGTELLDRGVDVDGVPQDDVVEHQAERAELVLQARYWRTLDSYVRRV